MDLVLVWRRQIDLHIMVLIRDGCGWARRRVGREVGGGWRSSEWSWAASEKASRRRVSTVRMEMLGLEIDLTIDLWKLKVLKGFFRRRTFAAPPQIN
ncbi:hypothetical protein L484_014333 [Morus notabilis]|uniref:Uncharacterized protein n=1 Tax=Morus notabilis TaxID=981085 RepID=W9S9T5_9ROSA|nr:hypothetical protein L484_014333 [Morus notabilis]